MSDVQIDVTALEVRRALARSFRGDADPGPHAWRGTVGVGDAVVAVDVEPRAGGGSIVHARARSIECEATPARLARILAAENAELVLGRFAAVEGAVDVEHAILAGTTMDAVEVQASVWAVGWAAASFAPRLRALVIEAVPVPPPPQTPAARLRDSEDHVELTTRRVRQHLDARYGGFDHHPDWGFHGAFGSARVFVEILPVLDDSTAVRVSSPVLSQVTMSDELALRLLSLAAEQPFGAFAHLAARDEVWLQHAILGDDLDRVELETAIDVVASTADGCDDELAREFGGLRYADLG
jgi:type III secretion system-like peptide-binding chaperone